jgi:hypothetical protein
VISLSAFPTTYDLSAVDQVDFEARPDLRPVDDDARRAVVRMLAMDATIYGLGSVYQYVQLYDQAIDRGSAAYTGFDRFEHQREMTTPEFDVFKTPNVDTLYSNAWLDLTGGPAVVTIPAMGDRYYTLHFLDLYANATNLSSRTVGPGGGTFLVAPPSWNGDAPAGMTVFRVATPIMWILMRILVRDDRAGDDDVVRTLQDGVTVEPWPVGRPSRVDAGALPAVTVAESESDWRAFFGALDAVIRLAGVPVAEQAYVYRFQALGIGGPDPFDPDALDATSAAAAGEGFADALAVLAAVRKQVGEPVGSTGWVTGTAGQCGFNYLRRALQNFVGTGGNVLAEKKFYAAFTSCDGAPLDASRADYRVRLAPPPPVAGHWSLTMYPVSTGLLYANEIERYAVSATTPGMRLDPDGALTIEISHEPPADGPANWLPAPAEPFYLDIRTWDPSAEVRDGTWQPGPIERIEHQP